MSVENAFEFMKKVSEDSQLQGEIDRLVAGKEGKETDAVVAELAKTHGCEFTADESFQARALIRQQLVKDGKIDDALTDEELEAVAGGFSVGAYVRHTNTLYRWGPGTRSVGI